jgi:hypothetical protein
MLRWHSEDTLRSNRALYKGALYAENKFCVL